MNRRSRILLVLGGLVFAASRVYGSSPAEGAYESYRSGDTNQQQACVERLVALSNDGLPYLDRLLALEEEKPSGAHRLLIDAIVRIDTEEAADVLMSRAQGYKSRIGYGDVTPVLANALARMGNKGLTRLLVLSKQTEAYREPWFMPEWRREKFIWFPKKQWRPTVAARAAREAVASVSDPAAVPTLVGLLDSPEMRYAALRALTSMRVGCAEDRVVRLWGEQRNPVALKYLLAINREKYLPLLQEKLDALDVEVARLLQNLGDLRARGVRDFPSDVSVIELVFELGGDPAANGTLTRYIGSRLWCRAGPVPCDTTIAYAVMALGLSKAPDARPVLVKLLTDATPINPNWTSSSIRQYSLDGTGRGTGMPLFVVAAKALEELGDPSVVPEIETLDTVDDPLWGRCFKEVTSALRAKSGANQVPEDKGRKLADPQH